MRPPDGASLIGFTNDITLIVGDHTTEDLEMATDWALTIIEGWMSEHGIKLANSKTEAVMLTEKWAYRQPNVFSAGHHVRLLRSVKYLSVTLDSKLTYTQYIKAASPSAIKAVKTVGRPVTNVDGPSVSKKRLLTNVAISKLLYAALIWTRTGLQYQINRRTLDRALRPVTL